MPFSSLKWNHHVLYIHSRVPSYCSPIETKPKLNLLYCIHTLATLEFSPAAETTWHDMFLRIINIRNKETY